MQRKSCKTLLTIRNFQKKCRRALAEHQSAISNCELQTANSNLKYIKIYINRKTILSAFQCFLFHKKIMYTF